MAKYNMEKEEITSELKKMVKDTVACIDIFIKGEGDDTVSYNTIINKYGKKYWGALSIIAQREMQDWMKESKDIEEMSKILNNK